ncbi:MAG: DUF4383 domain-containing protein [Parachlamydiaceae bacterium]|nr:DUF4383 domain-containing protein [Parachlamydiaceae bacterium]
MNSEYASRIFFQVFGIIYAIVALLGLYYKTDMFDGLLANNIHDVWLHAIIAIVSLYLGFFCHSSNMNSDKCNKL